MKKQLFGLMTILTVIGACQKNEVSVSLLEEVTIHATIEDKDATKTIMDKTIIFFGLKTTRLLPL